MTLVQELGGWHVGDTIEIDFWDFATKREKNLKIDLIETNIRAADGSTAHVIVDLNGREKDFGWTSFVFRTPKLITTAAGLPALVIALPSLLEPVLGAIQSPTPTPAPTPTPIVSIPTPVEPLSPPIVPPANDIVNQIWTYFTKTVPEFYIQDPAALMLPLGAALQGLEALQPLFKGTVAVNSPQGTTLLQQNLYGGIAKAVNTQSWTNAVISGIKSNPLMTIFVATEIPNYLQMAQFARNQVAQETGQTLPQIQSQLTSLENTMKNAGFDFSTAFKAGKIDDARAIATAMKSALVQYRATIDANIKWLTNASTLANANAIYDLYNSTITAAEAQLPVIVTHGTVTLPEMLDVEITKITDGDTVQATTLTFPPVVYTVRILGENAPDKDLTIYWVKSLIDGVELRYELKATDYKAANSFAVTNLMRTYCTLLIDPANQMDKYDRVLATIKYGPSKANFGLDMVRNGLAVAYMVGTNKYVDMQAFKDAQIAAMNARLGLWKNALGALPTTIPSTPGTLVPASPSGPAFLISVTSNPTNAKLFIDNIDVHHRTPSDQKELVKQLSMLAPGSHKFSASKTGMYGEVVRDIVAGDNGTILITLK